MADVYTHPGYVALLAAVKADPGNDLPRLILADFLDDRGEADRANHIRNQCDGGHRPADIAPAGWVISDILGNGATCDGWTRGFIEAVTCPADDWVAHSDALLAREPVRTVTLTDRPGWRANGTFQVFSLAGVAGWEWVSPWGAFDMPDDEDIPARLLRLRWPGITFQLPSNPTTADLLAPLVAREVAAAYGL